MRNVNLGSLNKGEQSYLPHFEDGSLLDLSNWRPITPLNAEFKIAAKSIGKRLEPFRTISFRERVA